MTTEKRKRGTGHIICRNEGTPHASWRITYSLNGRQIRESVAKALGRPAGLCTKEDAEQLLAVRLRKARPAAFAMRLATSLDEAMVIARVNELVTPSSPLLIGGAELKRLVGPIVYAYFRRWTPFYVGMSQHGIARPFSRTHHRLKRMWQGSDPLRIGTDDHVVIWPMRSASEAVAFERVVAAALLGTAAEPKLPVATAVSHDPQELFGT